MHVKRLYLSAQNSEKERFQYVTVSVPACGVIFWQQREIFFFFSYELVAFLQSWVILVAESKHNMQDFLFSFENYSKIENLLLSNSVPACHVMYLDNNLKYSDFFRLNQLHFLKSLVNVVVESNYSNVQDGLVLCWKYFKENVPARHCIFFSTKLIAFCEVWGNCS